LDILSNVKENPGTFCYLDGCTAGAWRSGGRIFASRAAGQTPRPVEVETALRQIK